MFQFLFYFVWLAPWLTHFAIAQSCPNPFRLVGNRCLFVDNHLTGAWGEIKSFCQAINGDLVNLEDANYLGDIFKYINDQGLNDVEYWTGANDIASEGNWVWTNNGNPVKMNTPLWGGIPQQPIGGTVQNCGGLHRSDNYYLHDYPCESIHSTICEKVLESNNIRNDSSSAEEKARAGCTYPYVEVGSTCIFVEAMFLDTYMGHKTFCELRGAHMLKIDDANLLGDVYDFLISNGLEENPLWIGATGVGIGFNIEWHWFDNATVQLGTPFWGVGGTYSQQPDNLFDTNCGALWAGNSFFFHDTRCTAKQGVICQTD